MKFVDYRGREKRVKAKMEKELKMKIACQLQQTFGEMNADAANKMKNAIGKSAKDLREKFLVLIKSTKAEKKGKNEQG